MPAGLRLMAQHWGVALTLSAVLGLEYSYLRRVRKHPKAAWKTLKLGVLFFWVWYVLLAVFFVR